MRRFRVIAMVVAMAVAAGGCGGDEGDDGEAVDEPTATTAPAATAGAAPTTAGGTTVPATNLTLRITDVRLVNSEESDNGMRVLLPAGVANASVTLTGLPSPNRVINVCQARELDSRLGGASCRTPASGEAVTVTLGSAATGVEIVQVGVSAAGPGGNETALEEVRITYTASSRELNVRLPQIAAGAEAGRPTFAMTPPSSDGAYRAALTWNVIPVFGGSPSSGQLELLQDGAVSQVQAGGSDVRINGNVPTPVGNVAIRVQNNGGSALVTPKLSALLP